MKYRDYAKSHQIKNVVPDNRLLHLKEIDSQKWEVIK